MDELRQQNNALQPEADEQSAFSGAVETAENNAVSPAEAVVCESVPAAETAAPADDGQAAPVNKKKQALIYILCAGIIFAGIYLAQLLNFTRPLFKNIYYGNLKTVFFMILCACFWIPCIIVEFVLVRKYCKINLFAMGKDKIPLKRSLIIYAIAFVTIFIISASLGFELKIVKELGKNVTQIKIITNASNYGYNAIKLIMATFIIELLQEAGELLWGDKHKYAKFIPYGGIAVAVVYGGCEVIAAYALKMATVFTWVNIALYLIFGIIYLLSNKRFTITYFVSLVIFIL